MMNSAKTRKTYGIEAWPFVYLVDADGKVFWEGNPVRWMRRERVSGRHAKFD